MGNSVVVKNDDYDFYQIKIPLALLGKRKQSKYISAELDKRHPCFSDDFCFDVQVDLKKNGFMGNVVVINKDKLADIKKNNPHKRIKISERKISVFDTGVKAIVKRNWFCVAIVVSVFLICLCSVMFVRGKEVTDIEIQNEVQYQNQIPEKIQTAEVNKIFDIIAENKGNISRLEWKVENCTESFSVSVNSMYPEYFFDAMENVNVSAVSYSKNIPLMVVKTNGFCNFQKSEERKQVYFVPLVRSVLKENDCIIKNEKENSLDFSFMRHEVEHKNVVLELSKKLKENGVSVSSLIIDYDGKSVFDVQLEIAETAAQIIDLELVSKNLALFIKDNEDLEPVRTIIKTSDKKSPGKKMGEVLYADGSKTVFYKSEDGKTIKVKESVNEKKK